MTDQLLQVKSVQVEAAAQLRFPGMMVCPPFISRGNEPAGKQSNAVVLSEPGLINSIVTAADRAKDGYAVCPQVVNFTNPVDANDWHACVDFSFKPVQRADLANTAVCDGSVPGNFYFPVNAPEFNMNMFLPTQDQAWTVRRSNILHDLTAHSPPHAAGQPHDGVGVLPLPHRQH